MQAAQQSQGGEHRRMKQEHDKEERDGSGSADEKGKRHRTAVLEHSVEQMQELQNLVHRLAAACTQQCSDIAALRLQMLTAGVQPHSTTVAAARTPHAMSLLSASMTRLLMGQLGAHGLYHTTFMSSSVGLMLVDCATGVAVDLNERLLVGGDCARENVVGRQVAPTYRDICTASWDSQPQPQPNSRMLVRESRDSNGRRVEASMYTQYGATKESVSALYRGQVDQIHVVWRAQLGDGLAYELPLSSFVASRDEGEGGRPRTVVVTLSLSEAKRI